MLLLARRAQRDQQAPRDKHLHRIAEVVASSLETRNEQAITPLASRENIFAGQVTSLRARGSDHNQRCHSRIDSNLTGRL